MHSIQGKILRVYEQKEKNAVLYWIEFSEYVALIKIIASSYLLCYCCHVFCYYILYALTITCYYFCFRQSNIFQIDEK